MLIKDKNPAELEKLCCDLRNRIIEVVSKNGGHFSSNIGAVELIVAMHFVFNADKDPFIFDVSHQAYAHKLLTDRYEVFDTLRQLDGISGYTNPKESAYDYFIAGHSSTSISLAVGAAKAINLKKEERIPVVLIGDGSLSGGMAFEALDELGDRKYPCVIILNDNKMSISKPIGALSKYLSQKMASRGYQKFKAYIEKSLKSMPEGATYMAKKFENSLKLITPGVFFEELGLDYIGPVNGHDLPALIETFQIAKELKKPVVIHAQTTKGKGYNKAEGCQVNWHGVSPFDIESGEFVKKSSRKSATAIFSDKLLEMADMHDNIVGVTAAMPVGTGLDKLIEKFPQRFWDVAIAEQHAVTSMAAMAKEGFKAYVAIYSTFMQRAYDQVIHDCCILNQNVVFMMDRAGIVGEDGETHQGLFDVGFMRILPNMSLLAPRCEESFKEVLEYSYLHQGPLSIRYPRGNFELDKEFPARKIELGKSEFLLNNESKISFIAYGNSVGKAYKVLKNIEDKVKVNLVDLVFLKPLDKEFLLNLFKITKICFVFSENVKSGGVAEILMAFLQENDIFDVKIISFEYEDKFISHGSTNLVEARLELDVPSLSRKVLAQI